jgi:sugar lactone lactonase YvrE
MSTTEHDHEPVVLSNGHAFLEGVRWHDGAAYASDFHKKQVLRWEGGEGDPEVIIELEDEPSGIDWTPEGVLVISSQVDRKLLKVVDGEAQEFADLREYAGGNANDLCIDGQGRSWVGNFGWDVYTDPVIKPAKLLRVDPDGSIHPVADGIECPNGIAVTDDEKTLYVAETFAARILAFDIEDDGSLSGRRVWASFGEKTWTELPEMLASSTLLPDGIALDAEGAIWATDCHGSGVTRVAEGGEVLDYVSSAPDATFSVGLSRGESPQMFMATTFPFGGGDPWTEHKSKMRRVPVDVPGAGYPA